MSEPETFGMRLRQYRLAASLSQEALGERASLSASAIASLERGRRRAPRPATVLMLAEALGLTPAERAALVGATGTARAVSQVDAEGVLPRLPVPLTSFVGRAQERAEVRRLLGSVRLLTLTGAAGVGKTRLAQEVARDVEGEVVFVELAPLADGALVPHAVASVLGVSEQPQQPLLQTLASALQARSLLLVLDNCEHLLAACAELAGTLLRKCLQLCVLATSREPLSIGGEVVWPVPGLTLPDQQAASPPEKTAESEAVRLFVERARAARPAFALTEQNARAVAEVCVQLDGMPLAIELAAARVRMLAPAQIADRLSDRFHLLAGGNRSSPTRHQSLQAAIDWSFDLLSESERLLLERLAVFAGGWTLEAAEAVCALESIARTDVLNLLSRLVDRSLVVAEPGTSGSFRYRLLETIREYAAERLERRGVGEVLSRRHRAWYLTLGEEALRGYWLRADLLGWWERLAPEQANFRAGLRFSLERGEPQPGLRLATGLWVLWGFRGPWAEGTEWIARLLALPGAVDYPAARADALTVAGQMTFELGDVDVARVLLLEAMDLQRQVGVERGLAMALDHAGLVASARGEFAAADAFHQEAVAIDRTAGNRGYEAISLEAWSAGAYLQGEYERARTLAEASLAIVNALDRGSGPLRVDANITLYILGRVALCTGDYASARQHFEANLAHWRGIGDARSRPAVGALVGLSCVAVVEGDLTQARALLAEALALSQQLGSGAALAYSLEGFAILAAAGNRPEQAVRLAGAATALRASLHHPISPGEHVVLERWLAPARRLLGEDVAVIAWRAGQATSAEQAIVCARTLEYED
ncbi:MAG TPA: helix-turn-helix domain-containing protein [Chloroflexota bacterium]|nr:helix-turn-helix domain-containing protein [Chloroflexota bacterium]